LVAIAAAPPTESAPRHRHRSMQHYFFFLNTYFVFILAVATERSIGLGLVGLLVQQ